MLIPITAGADGGGLQEWALVELQGKIEPQPGVDVTRGLVVGTMQLSQTNKDVVQLQIGYHVLEGRKVPLKKPLAILESHRPPGGSSSSSSGGMERGGGGGDSSSSLPPGSSEAQPAMTCKVVGLLRHKFLFKTRPKALISKPSR